MDTAYLTDESFVICNDEEIIRVQKNSLPTVLIFVGLHSISQIFYNID